jgi:hypothetical protein
VSQVQGSEDAAFMVAGWQNFRWLPSGQPALALDRRRLKTSWSSTWRMPWILVLPQAGSTSQGYQSSSQPSRPEPLQEEQVTRPSP